MILIRPEAPGDAAAIRAVDELAFGQPDEADLIDALRANGTSLLSLVAEREGEIVGHILFSPVTLQADEAVFAALALGPLAVRPEHQGRGIGSRLVEAGLQACLEAGSDLVFVLGHPAYYPRFGFVPTRPLGIRCEYDVPDDAFMLAELREGALAGRTGIVKYRPEFAGL
jgi:putative acetyltransferase